MSDNSKHARKRYFSDSWLNDDRYKSWIRKVPSNNNVFYCALCDKTISCSTHVARHMDSACHKNKLKEAISLYSDDDDHNVSPKTKSSRHSHSTFQKRWLEIEQFKPWLREVPYDNSLFSCTICDKTYTGDLWHIHRHENSKEHQKQLAEISPNILDENDMRDTLHQSFEDRKKIAEIDTPRSLQIKIFHLILQVIF